MQNAQLKKHKMHSSPSERGTWSGTPPACDAAGTGPRLAPEKSPTRQRNQADTCNATTPDTILRKSLGPLQGTCHPNKNLPTTTDDDGGQNKESLLNQALTKTKPWRRQLCMLHGLGQRMSGGKGQQEKHEPMQRSAPPPWPTQPPANTFLHAATQSSIRTGGPLVTTAQELRQPAVTQCPPFVAFPQQAPLLQISWTSP